MCFRSLFLRGVRTRSKLSSLCTRGQTQPTGVEARRLCRDARESGDPLWLTADCLTREMEILTLLFTGLPTLQSTLCPLGAQPPPPTGPGASPGTSLRLCIQDGGWSHCGVTGWRAGASGSESLLLCQRLRGSQRQGHIRHGGAYVMLEVLWGLW